MSINLSKEFAKEDILYVGSILSENDWDYAHAYKSKCVFYSVIVDKFGNPRYIVKNIGDTNFVHNLNRELITTYKVEDTKGLNCHIPNDRVVEWVKDYFNENDYKDFTFASIFDKKIALIKLAEEDKKLQSKIDKEEIEKKLRKTEYILSAYNFVKI